MTEQVIRSGRKAQELLEDETFNTALTKIENEQLWIFKSSKPEETAKREMAWSMIKAIDSLKIELTKTIDGEKVLNNVSFTINKGDKIAFMGGNSLAKTTLFQILAGEMEPDAGHFRWGVTISLSYFPKEHSTYFNGDRSRKPWYRREI